MQQHTTPDPIRAYAAYLFDADGTLIDTAELIYRCFFYSCRKFGGFEIDRDVVIRHIGLPLRKQLATYLGVTSPEFIEEVAAEHMKYQLSIYKDYLRLFPGIREGLELLHNKGRLLAVVSSRMRNSLELYLSETGIRQLFDALITPEDTKRHKPDPAPAYYALKVLGKKANEVLFVGDAQFDIECGSRAGIDTAFVAWSFSGLEELQSRPTYVIRDMAQLTAD